MKRKMIYLGCALLLCMGVIYSCSKGSSSTPPPTKTPPAGSDDITVQIENFAFSPASIKIKAGQTVVWTNKDSAPHTVTEKTGSFDSGTIGTNATYSLKFTTAGTFTYHCTIHAMMADATVVVQ